MEQRQHRIPLRGTAARKKSIRRAKEWLRQQHERERSRCGHSSWDWVSMPCEALAWTARLPGFSKAREAAVEATITTLAESSLNQELAAAENDERRNEIMVLRRIETGIGPVEELATEFRETLSVEDRRRLSRQITQALKNAKQPKKKTVNEFAIANQLNPIRLAGKNHTELLQKAAAFRGQRWSAPRRLLASTWVRHGLWLARSLDIEALLKRHDESAVLASFGNFGKDDLTPCERNRSPKRLSGAVNKWIKDLGLVSSRYKGKGRKGRLGFDPSWHPRPDTRLRQELQQADLKRLQQHQKGFRFSNVSYSLGITYLEYLIVPRA